MRWRMQCEMRIPRARATDHALSHKNVRRGNRITRYYLLNAVAASAAAAPQSPSGGLGGPCRYDVHTEGGEVTKRFDYQWNKFCRQEREGVEILSIL